MLVNGLKHTMKFGAGTAFGAFGVLKMDDMIYFQLRRHVVVPF